MSNDQTNETCQIAVFKLFLLNDQIIKAFFEHQGLPLQSLRHFSFGVYPKTIMDSMVQRLLRAKDGLNFDDTRDNFEACLRARFHSGGSRTPWALERVSSTTLGPEAPPDGSMPTLSRGRLLTVLFPALLGPLQLFVFGPHTIHAGNLSEFSAPFWSLAVHWFPALALSASGLIALGLLIPERVVRPYVAGLFAFGLLLWLQGNLLIVNYGVLNGQAIDWSVHAGRSSFEIGLWVVLPIVMVAAAGAVYTIAPFVSQLLIVLQTFAIVWSAAQAPPETPTEWHEVPESLAELSTTRNVIHIVLDGFQSDAFQQILEERRSEIDATFSGFVFFADHAGAFPTTRLSVPAMLTGALYRNQEPIQSFIRTTFRHASLFSVLRQHGYDVDAISIHSLGHSYATNAYVIPRPYASYDDYARFTAWQLIDLSLFRHTPHALKRWIYNDQAWRLQTDYGQGQLSDTTSRRFDSVNGLVFLEDFRERMRVARDTPVYKFLHVGIPHSPVVLNAACEFIGVTSSTRENYTDQVRCAISEVGCFLDRLRALGVYDESVIVLSSDHGLGLSPRGLVANRETLFGDLAVMAGGAMALLMVKAPRATGPLQTSDAPTTISDVPATVMDLLGLPYDMFSGESALQLSDDAQRERSYAWYRWGSEGWQQSYLRFLDIFSIQGPLRNGDAWIYRNTLHDPELDFSERTRGLRASQRDSRGQAFRWTGDHVILYGPPEARALALPVRSVAPTPQTVRVHINGAPVDEHILDDHAWRVLKYSWPSHADGTRVELFVDPLWRPGGGDERRLGVMTQEARWSP